MDNSMANNDIEKGITAARNGDKKNAQIFLVQGLKQDKNNLEGWLWLARIVDDPGLRRRCVNVIQRLDPNNLEANFMLAELENPLGQTVDKSVSPVSKINEASSPSTAPQKSSIKSSKTDDKKILNKSIWKIFGGVAFLFLLILCLGVSTLFLGYQLGWWGKEAPEVMVSPALGGENIFVEYIIDASGSMNDLLPDGVRKIDAARENLINSLKTYRPESSVGLRVYGHRIQSDNSQESCQDIELVAPVLPGYQGTIISWLEDFQALGMTPITSSLQQAAADFSSDPQQINSIVLISDGMETCGGDPCEMVKQLELQGFRFIFHVIGLNVDEPARLQLSCIASAGGGNYLDANTSEELLSALEQVQQQIILDAENAEAEPAALFEGQIAYIGPDMNIYVYRGDQASPVQITFDANANKQYQFLRWSPDGTKLAFLGGFVDQQDWNDPMLTLYVVEPGIDQPQPILNEVYGFNWYPGSNKIYYGSKSSSEDQNRPWIGMFDLDTGEESQYFPEFQNRNSSISNIRFPEFSQDGKWMMITEETIGGEINYIRWIFDFTNNSHLTFGPNDDYYDWSADGNRIIATYGYLLGGPGSLSSPDAIKITNLLTDQFEQTVFRCEAYGPGCVSNVLWTPQGNELVFGSPEGTMRVNPDGTSLRVMTDKGIPITWSPNGKYLLLQKEGMYLIYEPATDEILLEFAANSQKGIRYKNYFDWGILPSEAGVNNPQNSQVFTIPTPTSPVSVANLTLQQIYEMQWSLPIYGNSPTYAGPFSNGELTLDEIYYSAQIIEWVVGDLNADQVEDVALLIVERFGNTTYYNSLAVILNQNNQPVFGGFLTLEDLAGTTEKLKIQNGSILINGMWWMPGDPNCCPSKTGVTFFNFTSSGIQRLSE